MTEKFYRLSLWLITGLFEAMWYIITFCKTSVSFRVVTPGGWGWGLGRGG
jgi:hypothetical protein